MNKKLASSLVILLWAAFAFAAEVAGVRLADTLTVDGKALKLNGSGVRKKAIFKVYVAGLYLEAPSRDGGAALAAPGPKSIQLHILRGLKSEKITEAIREGFEKNSKAELPKLQSRLDKFAAMIPDVEEGDVIGMSWVPDKGTVVTVRGTERGTIEGRDFADALFAVWLGPNPVQEDLKEALLGGTSS